jgi:hypothetical protein
MASITIPRLVGKTNKAGLTTWYWQPSKTLRARGWMPLRLGAGTAGDPPQDVMEAARRRNAEADGAAAMPAAQVKRIMRPLTLGDLIDRFATAGYPSVKRPGALLDAATIRQYKSKLRRIRLWGGDVALASITPARVAVLRDALMEPAKSGRWAGEVRHHAAHETLRVGRTLFTWAEKKGLAPRGANPFTDFDLAAPDPRDDIWSPLAREALIAEALRVDDETGKTACPNMALAMELAFHTAQREGDLLKLTISHFAEIPSWKMDPDVHAQLAGADGRVMGIRLRQKKGKTWIEVPVVGATRERIELAIAAAKARNSVSILYDEEAGTSWAQPNAEAGQRRFIRTFAALRTGAIDTATRGQDHALARELATLQYRDFRRTAVVYLGELGIADQLIAAITGHSLDETKKILETYMPRTTGMAARAIALSLARAPAPKEEKKA